MRRSALRVCGWIGALASLVGCHKPPPLPPPMAQAQLAERRPDRSEAIREYQRIIELCGSGQAPASLRQKDDCGLAAFRLAQQLEQLEQFAEAADAYQQVEKLSHDPTKVARSLLRAAEIYADRLSQPGPAVELCQRILSSHPAEVAAEDALRAMVRWRRADPTLLPELDALAKKQSQHIPLASFAWLLSAQLAEEQGTVPDAVRRYDELARRYPKGPLLDDALIAAAKLLRGQKRYGEAAERLERLQRTYTSALIVGHYNLYLLSEGALLLGQIYLEDLRQPARAIPALVGFLKRQPTSRLADDALLLLAEACRRRHSPPTVADRTESCRYLARLYKQYPDTNQRRKADDLSQALACPAP
ncbi:MAG: tetratricopeptide repeat protein [Myxococcales bacterium]|jgi:tetratricopeptide (TPR) repeat protein|nr:tetratricopeptide repeat protein [Myxococcales bacterium]